MDLTQYIGKAFEEWTVIDLGEDFVGKRNNRHKTLRCRCSCGTVKDIIVQNLLTGKSKSCGQCKYKQYIGMRLGSLTVEEYLGSIKKGSTSYGQFLTRCDCGEARIVSTKELTQKRVYACKKCTHKNKLKGAYDSLKVNAEESPKSNIAPEQMLGKTYNMLTPIEIVAKPQDGPGNDRSVWLRCVCECGKEIIVRKSNIVNNITTSCGCKKRKNLVGLKVGKLQVLRESGQRSSSRRVIYECLCDCGNICYVPTDKLTAKKPQASCGCEISKGEIKILDLLKEIQVDVETQKTYEELKDIKKLRFDFHIRKHNLLIEFDGEQHFKSVKNWGGQANWHQTYLHDKMKEEFCKRHEITLLRIPYTEYDSLNKKFIEENIKSALRNANQGIYVTYVNPDIYKKRDVLLKDKQCA